MQETQPAEQAFVGEELTEVVRRWAVPTTPEELAARGVRSVRSVSMNRVAGLIEKAVNRTLIRRTLQQGAEGESDELHFSQAARQEFVRMMQAEQEGRSLPEDKTEEAATEAAGSALDRLKADLRNRRRQLQEQQSELSHRPQPEGQADADLERDLCRLFGAWGGDPKVPAALQEEVVRLAVRELRNERRRSRQDLIDLHRREVDLLERRVTKLSRELERTEAELARLAAREFEDQGEASMYSEVQGLNPADVQAEAKGLLMSAIFEANLELQAKLQAAAPIPELQPAGPDSRPRPSNDRPRFAPARERR